MLSSSRPGQSGGIRALQRAESLDPSSLNLEKSGFKSYVNLQQDLDASQVNRCRKEAESSTDFSLQAGI